MTESGFSEEQKNLMAGYILHNLSAAEAAQFEQLMATNPAIAQEVDAMQRSLESVYLPIEIQPPDHLRASILNAAQANFSKTKPAIKTAQLLPFKKRWNLILGSAAAVLIVGLSISNLVLWRSLQTLQAVQSQTQETNWLTVSLQPQGDRLAPERVMVDPQNLQAILNVENLPPLPEGQVYVLWTVLQPDAPFTTDYKNAILTEVLATDGQNQTIKISLPPVFREQQWVKAIAISIEAVEAPQRHLSKPILLGSLSQ